MNKIIRIRTALLRWASVEDGATTVDFVVGVAAGVAMAMTIMNAIGGATHDHSAVIGDKYDEIGIMSF